MINRLNLKTPRFFGAFFIVGSGCFGVKSRFFAVLVVLWCDFNVFMDVVKMLESSGNLRVGACLAHGDLMGCLVKKWRISAVFGVGWVMDAEKLK